MKRVVSLVDCNNFYVSCERVFKPEIVDKPVVVLSNNDGCVVARSNEAKQIGVPFGKPFFECEELINKHNIFVFSSNYELYGDMSVRVMDTLSHFTPNIEIYSIDEAFLDLTGFKHKDLNEYGDEIRNTVKRWTGIPVSIGIASTKTLAKIANHMAKKYSKFNGVMDISGWKTEKLDALLKKIEVGDIWGIGRQYKKFLNRNNIFTAYDLKECRDSWIRKNLTVVGLRTVFELRGERALELEDVDPPNKQIVSSRSFGKPVTEFDDIAESVATYASRAAERLRKQDLLTTCITVFMATNRFKENEPQYSNSISAELTRATDDTSAILNCVRRNAEKIFRKNYKYKKSGVMLTGIEKRENRQMGLFASKLFSNNQELMKKMDKINNKWGKDTIRYASTGYEKTWKMQRNMKTPSYTTNWNELPVAKAKLKKIKEE